MPEVPTIATGTRGTFLFDLVVDLRPGGVHSGHWGGLTTDPAVVLAHALGTIIDRRGKILVRDWLPRNGVPAGVRAVLAGCPVGGGGEAATIDPGWGEPGLTPAEKIYGWNSFIVLSMLPAGRRTRSTRWRRTPARIARSATRSTPIPPASAGAAPASGRGGLHRCADREPRRPHAGEPHRSRRIPGCAGPSPAWSSTLGKRVQVIPNSSGGLPGDVFVDHLGMPLIWVPHSYNGCKQHGPDEHFLLAPAREGIAAFAGIWWDLGEQAAPQYHGIALTGRVAAVS